MVKRIIVKFMVMINGEWYQKEKTFTDYKEAFEYMSGESNVYKFTVNFIRSAK